MSYVLREYQRDALAAIKDKLGVHQSTIAVLPTGSGKSVLFAAVAGEAKRGRVMILVHREELAEQNTSEVHNFTGLPVDIEMADRKASQLHKTPIVVSSIQTQISGRNGNRRMHEFDPKEFSLVIVDEFHHAAADTWKTVIGHYLSNPACKLLGVTATPKRSDQLALGAVCGSVAFRMGIVDAIQEGWLVNIHQIYVKVLGLDYKGVDVRAGDFVSGQLSDVMCEKEAVAGVCAAIHQHAGDKTSLVFCVDVAHAENVTAVLNEYHPGYAHLVTGETPSDERRAIIADYRRGGFPCLVNCMIASEGFNVPRIEYVVMARPTKSALLYEQMLGRATRSVADIDSCPDAASRLALIAASAKPFATVIDFVGNSEEHQIVTAIDVLGGKMRKDAIKLAELRLDKAGGGDVLDIMRSSDAELQRQEKTRHAKAVTSERIISPFKRTQNPFTVFGIDQEAGKKPIEDWQKEKLEQWRVPLPTTSEEADDLIEEFRSRTRRGLATYRMAKLLNSWGYDGTNMAFEEASATIRERLG